MVWRKIPLVTGGYYHVFNKSIAGFEIFRFDDEYVRMREVIRFYRTAITGKSYSIALKREAGPSDPVLHGIARVRLIAYCLMPTHVHFLVQQSAENGVTDFMRCVQGSYSNYFNMRTKRHGPLWVGRFGSRPIRDDEDLLHLTRYLHLNPTSAGIVKKPDEWQYSSFYEYLGLSCGMPLCDFQGIINLPPAMYREFVNNQEDYQRSLQIVKAYMLD